MSDALITVIIPTLDEEAHIARCIDSASALGRVVVVDCGSADRTQAIARTHGADVVEHAWPGHAAQKNWALDHVIATPWALFLDADEYLTPEAVAEIREAVACGGADGYQLARRYIFLGEELRHAWWYPDYQLRLFRRERGRVEDVRVHEHVVVRGRVRTLRHAIMHENRKGIAAFIERHNRYAALEAEEILRPSQGRRRGSFAGSWAERRRALKDRIWFRLPARPLVRFAWLYVVKRGFLDGRRGFLFCALIASYDVFIDAQVTEQRLAAKAHATAASEPQREAA